MPPRGPPRMDVPSRRSAKVTAADVEVGARTALADESPPASVVREEAGVLIGHLCHSCVGLSLVALLRAVAFRAAARPAGDTRVAHCLSSASDVAALALGLQVLCCECALRKDVLGSIVTLLLAAALCDLTACAALLSARGAPWGEGCTSAGIWEGALVASAALQAALLRGTWELYGLVRMLSSDDGSPVSPLECICEEENAQLLSDCGTGKNHESSIHQESRRGRLPLVVEERLELKFAEDHEDLMVERVGYVNHPFRVVAESDSMLPASPTESVRAISRQSQGVSVLQTKIWM